MESKSTKKINKKLRSSLDLKHCHFVPDLPFPLDEDLIITYYLLRQVGSSFRIVYSDFDYSAVRAVMDDKYSWNPRQQLFIVKFVSSLQRLTL